MSENTGDLIIAENYAKPNKFWIAGPKEYIFRYLWYLPFLIMSIGIMMVMAYIKVRYTTQIFKVQSSILVKSDPASSSPGSKDERFQQLFMVEQTANLSNEIEMLHSRPVLQRVARDLGLQQAYYNKGNVKSSLLYPYSPFTIDVLALADSTVGLDVKVTFTDGQHFMLNESKTPYSFGQEIQLAGNRFRLLENASMPVRSFGSMVFEVASLPLSAAAEGLLGSLSIQHINEESTILTLSFEGENTTLGKDVLNTLMAVYDTLMVEDKNRIAGNTLRFINDRLNELNDTIKGVRGGVRNYMVENKIFDVENQSKDYLEKMGDVTKLQAEQAVKISIADYLLTYVSNKNNLHELVPSNLGIEEPALVQLISAYNILQLERERNAKTTPATNPLIVSMDNSLDKIRQEIFQTVTNVKHAYQIAVDNLNGQNQQLQAYLTSLPGKSMVLLNIEQQQKILEDLYSLLLQKKLEISLSSASTISNLKVVEPAIADQNPISPDKKKTYSFYFLVGLLVPVALIALREVLQDKIRGRTDVEKLTSTPILGEIGHSAEGQSLVVTSNSRRLISEQFRIVRTNLQYVIAKKQKPVIMVTSSFSGEGKSFVSTNLGAVMALSGKKTVIMEFDIRKPKIVSGLELKRKMGITNYIIGKAKFDELLVKVEGVDDLYVIPCGPIPPNPSELLLDSRLDELMKEVVNYFDIVIMDTAPVGLVSDAINLGRYADCSVYIVRQGHTFRKQIGLIEELYTNKKLPGLCVLLNDVKAEGGYYGGYYGGGYGYYGGYGYGRESGYFEERGNSKKGSFLSKIKKMFKGGKSSRN